MLGTAKEEIKKSDEMWDSPNRKALREQQEEDFGLWGPHEFKMPESQGAWDSVTTNSPKVLANKLMGLLSSSWLQLYIDVDEVEKKPNKAGRNKISDTERLANGCIWIADREAISVPSGKKLQDSLSSFAVLRGGTVKSVYWYTDDDEKPVCAITAYDPFGCQWIEGGRAIVRFCYREYVTKESIEHDYEEKVKGGFNYGSASKFGTFLKYTFWDDNEWKVAFNGEYIDEFKHGLGYIPVNIRPCGSVPYMQSEQYQDTMKWSWMSFAHNTRDIYDLESKLYSIESSKAIESGRKDAIGVYDSEKSGGKTPDIAKLGYGTGQRSNFLLLDSAKGQDFKGFVEHPDNRVVDQFLSRVTSEMDVMATIDPIARGSLSRSGVSGTLADILTKNALEFSSPFFGCVEEDYKWIAEEVVRQFKNGQYGKISVEGRDRKRAKFYVDLEPKDVEEKHFDCELVADKLRDEIAELGAAIEEVSYDLNSRKGAMLKHNIVADPDRTFDEIAQEKHVAMAATDPVMHNKELANWYHDEEENDEMALYHLKLAEIAIKATIMGMMSATQGEEGEKKPPVVSPQADAMRAATESRKPA